MTPTIKITCPDTNTHVHVEPSVAELYIENDWSFEQLLEFLEQLDSE